MTRNSRIRLASITLACAALLLASRDAAGQETVGPSKGALVIVGGAMHQDEILARFIELAGGPHARIVVVPTAASSSEQYDYTNHRMADTLEEHYKIEQITIVHTHDREVADTEAFVAPIGQATGVWFSGGRQWRLTKAYRGTRTEKAFHDVLRRGGVIGGSSAGATIQGSFLARGDTRGNGVMIGDFQHGFAFLENAAIDQHVVPRKRQLDMIHLLEDPTGLMLGTRRPLSKAQTQNATWSQSNRAASAWNRIREATRPPTDRRSTCLHPANRDNGSDRRIWRSPGRPAWSRRRPPTGRWDRHACNAGDCPVAR